MRKVTSAVNFDGKVQTDRWYVYDGTGNFSLLELTATVYHDFREIMSISVTALGADAAANGALTPSGFTQNSDGSLKPTTAGQLTINREVGIDSGLGFSITIKGR